ncbi:MAG TPA: hypothetical protein VK558_12290 [Patescibacteria group bacterium]|nr:hypothetical protein [Patescibacteria group bacterium]
MPKTPDNWPTGALPRMLDTDLAAYYCGLSATTFLARVEAGSYPKAISIGRRQMWDRAALDAAMDKMSNLRRPVSAKHEVNIAAESLAAQRVAERMGSGG